MKDDQWVLYKQRQDQDLFELKSKETDKTYKW